MASIHTVFFKRRYSIVFFLFKRIYPMTTIRPIKMAGWDRMLLNITFQILVIRFISSLLSFVQYSRKLFVSGFMM